jgi:protein-disulfide isomerase
VIRSVFIVCAGALVLAAGAAGEGIASPAESAVAEVNGVKLTLDSLLAGSHSNALFQAKNTYYEAERKTVDDLIDSYLLEQRAREEHVSVSQLLKKHVDDTIAKDPSEESLRVYYEGLDTKEPYEAVRDKIIQHIREKRLANAKAAYMKSLRDSAKISILLEPPRANISLANTPVRGSVSSPVVFVEFADYECPYCQQAQPALDRMEAEFKGKVAFVYKDLPLPMHTHAQKAAEAAQCAGLQNKYWEYHDYLFKTKQLEVKDLKEAARQIGLDSKAFDACLDSGERAEAVKATLGEAQTLGLQGTPSFFVNGRYYSGIMPYEQIQQIVEGELSRLGGNAAEKTAASLNKAHGNDGGVTHASLH